MALYVSEKSITPMREQRDFADVANRYKLIDRSTRALFIWNYNDESRHLYALMRSKDKKNIPLSRQEFRKMQQYSVQVYENWLYKAQGLFEESASGVLVWNSGYNQQTGLQLDPNIIDLPI
jgi:CRISPR-associated endonuclease/helicase Cas3